MTARRADAQRNRELILRAAGVALARDPDVSLAAIAKEAGVSRATVYRHFASVAEVQSAVLENVKDVGREVLQEGLGAAVSAVAGGGTVAEQILRLFQAGVEGEAAQSETFSALPHPEDELLNTFGPVMRATVVEGQRRGEFSASLDPESTALALIALMVHSGRRGHRLGLPVEQVLAPVAVFIRGMETAPTRSEASAARGAGRR